MPVKVTFVQGRLGLGWVWGGSDGSWVMLRVKQSSNITNFHLSVLIVTKQWVRISLAVQ